MIAVPDQVFSDAVREFWLTRENQSTAQAIRGQSDQGARSAVTGGRQLDGFVRCVSDLLISIGVPKSSIFTASRYTALPGFFRPTKAWDLLVVSQDVLVAAIEFKSQVSSFGNNFNNRVEEALGSAVDIWTAYREGAFGDSPAPWLGYMLVLADSADAHRSVSVREPHFKAFPEFVDTSYVQRYEILCRRLVLERKYSAACLLLTDQNKVSLHTNYIEPAEGLSATRFLTQLLRHASLYL